MKPDTIQERALKTWYPDGHPGHYFWLHPAVGLAGEAGELLNLVKKHTWKPGISYGPEDLIPEIGDCLYYLAILAYQCGKTLDEISLLNRAKLENGKNGWPESAAWIERDSKE